MGSVFTCKLNPCCGDRRNCTPPPQYNERLPEDRSLDEAAAGVQEPADVASLDERMKAAGMIPLSDLLAGNTPLEKWMAHTGVRDLDSFEQWLQMRQREIGHLMAAYELGDKDKTDELYEWVHSHFAAFGEVAANFRAMKERSPAPAGVQVKALEWSSDDEPVANCFGGGYAIFVNDRGARLYAYFPRAEKLGIFDTLEAAKSAAQADYETRIRSALIAPPAADAPVECDGYKVTDAEAAAWAERHDIEDKLHRVSAQRCAIEDARSLHLISAAAPPAAGAVPVAWQPTHVHVKRGSAYRVIDDNARLQASGRLDDNEVMVIYEGEDGARWVRANYEFFDGRFEPVAAPTSPVGEER